MRDEELRIAVLAMRHLAHKVGPSHSLWELIFDAEAVLEGRFTRLSRQEIEALVCEEFINNDNLRRIIETQFESQIYPCPVTYRFEEKPMIFPRGIPSPGEQRILDLITDNPDALTCAQIAADLDSTTGSIKVMICNLRHKGFNITSPHYRSETVRRGVPQTYRLEGEGA